MRESFSGLLCLSSERPRRSMMPCTRSPAEAPRGPTLLVAESTSGILRAATAPAGNTAIAPVRSQRRSGVARAESRGSAPTQQVAEHLASEWPCCQGGARRHDRRRRGRTAKRGRHRARPSRNTKLGERRRLSAEPGVREPLPVIAVANGAKQNATENPQTEDPTAARAQKKATRRCRP